jgi:rhamnosyltransferase
MPAPLRVCAVVVTYHPEPAALARLLDRLSGQVDRTVMVDNTPLPAAVPDAALQQRPGLQLVRPGANLGVAAGHNLGIAQARQAGASHVLLLDQDSEPAVDMVARLLETEAALRVRGERIAALGPRFIDPRYGYFAPFIRLEGWRIRRVDPSPAQAAPEPADYLITSGSLIRLDTLDAVGGMDDALFIDYVDIEWGLRAKALGFQCFGVPRAQMVHTLGDAPVRFMNRLVPLHSPLRHYYHFRNALLVYRKRSAPPRWVVNDAFRLLLKFVFYGLFATPRGQHLRMMARGLRDGMLGRAGPIAGSG